MVIDVAVTSATRCDYSIRERCMVIQVFDIRTLHDSASARSPLFAIVLIELMAEFAARNVN
jgi:hypothetical protein